MGVWTWWRRKRAFRVSNKLARTHFSYWWKHYQDKDCPERDALGHYLMAEERHIGIGDLLWEQGYRHGDHVLVFEPTDGAFQQKVMTRFYESPLLMPSDMAAKFEATQGTRVKPGDRTQLRSQPDFNAHETGSLIPIKEPCLSSWLP